MVIGEINHRTAHVMNILWLVGTFTFAIVLGVVTEDIVNHVVVSTACLQRGAHFAKGMPLDEGGTFDSKACASIGCFQKCLH